MRIALALYIAVVLTAHLAWVVYVDMFRESITQPEQQSTKARPVQT